MSARGAPVRLAMRVRRSIERELRTRLSPAARELASPLLFGDRSAMTPEMDASLRGSGLVHLLALSGLHVAWLAGVVRGLVAAAGARRRARAASGAVSAAAYALLAGPLPSLLRAVAGESLAAIGALAQRSTDAVQSLGVSAIVLLAWGPGWANDLGFQLSFAATLGLVTLGGLRPPIRRGHRLEPVLGALVATGGAQAAAIAILVQRFHALPWTGLVANLVAVPLAEWMLAAAALGGIVGALQPGAGALALAAVEPLARALAWVSNTAASWPGALLAIGHAAWIPTLAASAAALGMLATARARSVVAKQHVRPRRARVAAATAIALGAVALGGALAVRPMHPPPGSWWIVALDVGQGDALALGFSDGWWLIDTGPHSPRWDAGESVVMPFFRWAGVRRLSLVALTHDDGDHTGGANAVRRSLPAAVWIVPAPRPGVPGPGARWPGRAVGRDDTLHRSPIAVVRWPPRPGEAEEEVARRGDNAAALVLEVGAPGPRALFTADADSLVEARLDVAPGLAWLKAGHHGSASSNGEAFLDRVRPAVVLVSCGRHNAYGHPSPLALVRFARVGARVDRTDVDGAHWYAIDSRGVCAAHERW